MRLPEFGVLDSDFSSLGQTCVEGEATLHQPLFSSGCATVQATVRKSLEGRRGRARFIYMSYLWTNQQRRFAVNTPPPRLTF
jgi:hypothetical protein